MTDDDLRPGLVVAVDPGAAEVALEDDPGGPAVRCSLRGRLLQAGEGRRAEDKLVVVGDRVRVRLDGEDGTIEEVLPRTGVLSRRGRRGEERLIASGVELLVVVSSAAEPAPRPRLVDRYLVAAASGSIPASVVVVNKMDLVGDDERGEILEMFAHLEDLQVPLVPASAETGEGMDALREAMSGRTCVFAGQSGVGKSSLAAALLPDVDLPTAEVSNRSGKGRHTTTRSRMLPAVDGGRLIDTPGVRSFAPHGVDAADLALLFPDFADLAGDCRFSNCSHDHEPGCAVRAAVEAGDLDAGRLDSYHRILHSLEDDRPR